MSTQTLDFDDAATRAIEIAYTSKDVIRQREETLRLLDLRPGERAIDIGSGPGFLAAEMAEAVGPQGEVLGIDISESMLAYSQAHVARLGLKHVSFELGRAEAVPVEDASYDVGTSTQVYEYLPDVDLALRELYRVLRPGGRALVLDTDWDTLILQSPNDGLTQRIFDAWAEHLIDPNLPRTLKFRLERQGFSLNDPHVIPIVNTRLGSDTYAGGLIELIKGFVPGHDGVNEEDVSRWIEGLESLSDRGQFFLSINRYAFLANKPSA